MAVGTQIIFAVIAAGIALHYSGKTQVLLQTIDKAVFGSYGCIPAPMIQELTLQYFKTRGRGEGIRMILQDNNVPYSEISFDSQEWPAIKQTGIEMGILTFGQVPAVTTKSGVSLVQSLAIIHYIGRSLGLDCECDDYHTCEVIALGAEDLRGKLGKVTYDPKFSRETRNAYLTDVLPSWLTHFEMLAPEIIAESNDSFFIGDRLTWIDYVVFELIDCNMEFSKNTKLYFPDDNVNEDILEGFPRLKHFYLNFYDRPLLKKYLVSQSRLPYKLPHPPASADKTTEKTS